MEDENEKERDSQRVEVEGKEERFFLPVKKINNIESIVFLPSSTQLPDIDRCILPNPTVLNHHKIVFSFFSSIDGEKNYASTGFPFLLSLVGKKERGDRWDGNG